MSRQARIKSFGADLAEHIKSFSDLSARMAAIPSPMALSTDVWLIMKRDLYYRPNGAGYTGIRDLAGRYSYDEAKAHQHDPGPGGDKVSIIRLADAPELTKACFADLALKHLQGKAAAMRAALAEIANRANWSEPTIDSEAASTYARIVHEMQERARGALA